MAVPSLDHFDFFFLRVLHIVGGISAPGPFARLLSELCGDAVTPALALATAERLSSERFVDLERVKSFSLAAPLDTFVAPAWRDMRGHPHAVTCTLQEVKDMVAAWLKEPTGGVQKYQVMKLLKRGQAYVELSQQVGRAPLYLMRNVNAKDEPFRPLDYPVLKTWRTLQRTQLVSAIVAREAARGKIYDGQPRSLRTALLSQIVDCVMRLHGVPPPERGSEPGGATPADSPPAERRILASSEIGVAEDDCNPLFAVAKGDAIELLIYSPVRRNGLWPHDGSPESELEFFHKVITRMNSKDAFPNARKELWIPHWEPEPFSVE